MIGPDGTPRDYPGDFEGTPAFLGCSDVDPHIRKDRVGEAGDVYKRMGAELDVRLYPGMGHTVNQDEIDAVRKSVEAIQAREAGAFSYNVENAYRSMSPASCSA